MANETLKPTTRRHLFVARHRLRYKPGHEEIYAPKKPQLWMGEKADRAERRKLKARRKAIAKRLREIRAENGSQGQRWYHRAAAPVE